MEWFPKALRTRHIFYNRTDPLYNRASPSKHHLTTQSGQSASDKLFADAEQEELKASQQARTPSQIPFLENNAENWDGDERIQDTILRMLVDKHKPLRTGTILSADQKLKHSPPRVAQSAQVIIKPTSPSTGSWATEPLLPSSKDHQPWHTEFKTPSYATSSIKQAYIPPLTSPTPANNLLPTDNKLEWRRKREDRKKTELVGRLARARESTLDYRLGIKGSSGNLPQLNPVSLKGWSNFIEDRIQKAQKAGLFNNVTGRGRPLKKHVEESNPFIAREEFLMNRIVQRNGAAPAWVEIQNELDGAVSSFRQILRQSWIRQAVRAFTTSTPPSLLHTITIRDIRAFRDPEWERREGAYHQLAVEKLNSFVRRYNGIAPYAVRRPYYSRSAEYEKMFEACAKDVAQELARRVQGKDITAQPFDQATAGQELGSSYDSQYSGNLWTLRDLFLTWLQNMVSKFWPK